MRFILKDYQSSAADEVEKALRRASGDVTSDPSEYWSVSLSAPTGAGKTVVAASVIESLFDGSQAHPPDPLATVLWVTDDPALNEQTRRNMLQASSSLTPGRLISIDSGFDAEVFDPQRVYFLNIQKLARSNPLARSNTDSRTYSLWQTIAKTIETNGAHFFIVIDEAHRGMRPISDRRTIVSRIINGQNGVNPPAPIVWGISATPERFVQAIERWEVSRLQKAVVVPLEDVRSSGLLKDKIILDSPALGEMEADTTLIRAAAAQTKVFEEDWRRYTAAQGEPAVLPVMVVQVPNLPSDAELSEYLTAIFESWEGLRDPNVVNTFGEHTAISVAGHTISYREPQDIQDDNDVRVVLCKDAISTGWDCPRAEVLVSLRRAEDYTYITQLIGRMVRTPLARRIPTDQSLNDVHCYLPRFDKSQVDAIVARFTAGNADEPPVEIITNPVRIWRNESVESDLFELVEGLPTYVVPGRIYRTQIARLHTLATLLSGDNIVEDAVAQAQILLNGVLIGQRQKLENDGTFQRDLARVQSLRIERRYALLAAESMEDLPVESYEAARDENNIEDLFKVAVRKLPEGVAKFYWNSLLDVDDVEDFDPVGAKAMTAVLALHPEVVEAVQSAAEQQVRTWLREHQRSISKLPDARKTGYEPVKRETRDPELTDLVFPATKVVSDATRWKMHMLADENGLFPADLKGWEAQVLEKELADTDLVGWYRNPTGGSASLRVPYKASRFDRALYPDFILFHRTEVGIRPSIVDPHGFHLADASAKLKGLAQYAEVHTADFDRIEAVAEIDGGLLALDLRSSSVRDAIRLVAEGGVRELFEAWGGRYN